MAHLKLHVGAGTRHLQGWINIDNQEFRVLIEFSMFGRVCLSITWTSYTQNIF